MGDKSGTGGWSPLLSPFPFIPACPSIISSSSGHYVSLRFRHMQTLTAHEAAVDEEDEDDGVEFERGALESETAG